MRDDVGLDIVEVVESFWEDPDIFFRGPFMKRLKISSSRFLGESFCGKLSEVLDGSCRIICKALLHTDLENIAL